MFSSENFKSVWKDTEGIDIFNLYHLYRTQRVGETFYVFCSSFYDLTCTYLLFTGGVLRLRSTLSHFVWGVTLELLRVTELFVDQCEDPEKKEKKEKKMVCNGDSIPVLKPVPLLTDNQSEILPALEPPQVEIVPLPNLQKLLLQSLPTTRVKILKIPFHATWRQSITDTVN